MSKDVLETAFETIEVAREDRIGIVTLNRPNQLNAISRGMIREIVTAFEAFDEDPSVRIILLKGNGRAFAAGADIHEMANEGAVDFELKNQFADWDRLLAVKTPVVAAVHGFVLGGGFELALTADMIVAAESTQFGFPEVKLGVMPGAGGTQRITKQLGRAKAFHWLWTGDSFSATQAERDGLISVVVPDELAVEEAFTWANRLAGGAPIALRLIKEAVNAGVDLSIAEGMFAERKNFSLLFATEDQKEGMRAFQEKRSPRFQGR